METQQTNKPYRPRMSGPCLCGSGRRFRECCKNHLPGFEIGEKSREMATAGRWLLAIKYAQADITQYTIWHRSHTVRAINIDPTFWHSQLMQVDIEALSDYVECLMGCYGRYGWLKKLPAALNRLEANIDDLRWRRKITYQRGICALWGGDRAEAVREIEQLQPIMPSDDDIDLLQLHVDLHGDQMGISEKISFFERILELTTNPSDKLQYGGAHAANLFLVGDQAGARTKFDEIIALGRQMEEEKPLSIIAESWFCRLLEGRAAIDKDESLYDEIIARLSKLVADEAFTDAGRGETLRLIGDANRYASRYTDALTAYRAAYKAAQDQLLHVFEAECELNLGNSDEALLLIRTLSVDELNDSERVDHAFIFSYIALARRDRDLLTDARELLRLVQTPPPVLQHT